MANEMNMTNKRSYVEIPVWRRYTLTIEEAADIITSGKAS